MKRFILPALVFVFLSSFSFQESDELYLTKYVNPFIGTGGHGHTFPGATVPFGMVQLSPDTRLKGWDGCSGYHYSDSIIYGFSHTHLSGTGVPDYCDILFMPFTDNKFIEVDKNTIRNFTSSFSHLNELAEPGYYSVLLNRSNIKAELTASTRAGFHKYSFPEGNEAKVFIDLKHRDEVLESHIKIVNNNSVSGFRRSKSWAQDQRIYFYAVFSDNFKRAGIYSDDNFLPEKSYAEGKNIKAIIEFDNPQKPLLVKVGISAISEENAKLNLEAEIGNKDFDKVRKDANELWNDYLNKIQVKTKDIDKLRIFYTALYHTAIAPNIFNDVDGSYLGRDFKVHKANHEYYTVFSLWDTYRALHPLLNIIERKRSADFIKTFLLQYEQGGRLPVWELGANETDCMIGYHSVPVIVDAYNSGITDFDKQLALKAMMHSSNLDIYGLQHYRNDGFISADKEHESVSKTLEYAFDDWCIANFAKSLKENIHKDEYEKRAQFYKNVFDPQTGFMRPRFNNGWKDPFNPTDVDNNYTEANSWQYSFYVPHDIKQLNDYLDGNLEKKLDELFSADTKTTGREQVDITGLIGQYAHGNEPSHHIAYLYNYTDSSHKTQKIVRKIMSEFYKDSPDGLIGNEDCGQMSAWYILSAMGFYPVTPGSGKFLFGSPIFDEVKINLENGKTFTIKTNNQSDENIYIQNVSNEDKRPFINWDDIFSGGTITFDMENFPSKSFGTGGVNKYLLSDNPIDNEIIPSPYTNTSRLTFKDSLSISLFVNYPNAKIYYNIIPNQFTEYLNPISIIDNTSISAYAVDSKGNKSETISSVYYKILKDIKVQLLSVPNMSYTAGGPEALIDHIRGEKNWRLGNWQGYQGQDFSAVVDLGKENDVSKISIGFLQDARSWIWMPKYVDIYSSIDNMNYQKIGSIENTILDTDLNINIKDFILKLDKSHKARYIKVTAVNYGKIPAWHPGAGDDAFIFVDEIETE
ncbi:MAG: GH92 family glycosyl hydrolase [Ignavibacteria bacterium]